MIVPLSTRSWCGWLLVFALVAPGAAEAASCRHRPPLHAGIRQRVESLRALEREGADRVKGLDTRTFEYLAVQAHGAAAAIADARLLRLESALARCRVPPRPLRRLCTEAGTALAGLIDQQAARGTAAGAKQAYRAAMPKCEAFLALAPLATIFRSGD